MAEYLSPGVYVEEYDSSERSIEGVGTSTAGFVGMAVKGPIIGAPELVTNFPEFLRKFGGYLSELTHGDYRYLAYSVEQFFINGGNRCFVMRVVPDDAKSASIELGKMRVTAANPGKWGEKIVISMEDSVGAKMQVLEKTGDTTYKVKSSAGFRDGDIVKFGEEYNRLTSVNDVNIKFEDEFIEDIVDASMLPKKFVTLCSANIVVRYDSEIEAYENISLNVESTNFIVRRMARSELVRLEYMPNDETASVIEILTGESGKNFFEFSPESGTDGTMDGINAGTYIGVEEGPGKRTGIQSFLENDNVSLMAVPGVTIPEVIVSLIIHCENLKSRFAIFDIPRELVKTSDIIEYRNMVDSTYAAMYHPWLQVYDKLNKKPGFIPPSGAVAGIYARTDATRGIHKAPANEIVFCNGLSTNFNSGEQDILNPAGVNLIRSFPGQGIRVWGARTATSNTSFKYVNIRRLFIFVEESIKAATNWVVFEPNDPTLWGRVSLTISTFLEGMWRAGYLAGASADEAFFVDIGATTMSRDDIMNGRLICNIGIAPSRPAEFVIFRITQHTNSSGGGEE